MSSKWLYIIKHVTYASIEELKRRFVGGGLFRREGVDYAENFAPVAKYTSFREDMSLAPFMEWRIHDMDAKTTFVIGRIEEGVYIEQPQCFEVNGAKSHVRIFRQLVVS